MFQIQEALEHCRPLQQTVVTQSFAGHLSDLYLAAISIACTLLTSITFGFLPVLSGVAVGSGQQAVVAYINIGSCYFVGIPLGVLLGRLLPSGIVGVWTGMMSGTVVQTLTLIIVTMRYDWEREVGKAQILVKEDAKSNQ